MSRASRLGLVTAFFTALYLLAFFQIVAVPFVDDKVVQEILPVVSLVRLFAYFIY